MDALSEKRPWISQLCGCSPFLGGSLWGNVQKGAVVKGVSDLQVTLAMDSHHSMDVFYSPLFMQACQALGKFRHEEDNDPCPRGAHGFRGSLLGHSNTSARKARDSSGLCANAQWSGRTLTGQ